MGERIYVQAIIEVAGKPVEKVQEALDAVEVKLKEEKKLFHFISSHIGEPQLDDTTTLFGGFLDCELEFESSANILSFVMNYTPTSIEVTRPERISLEAQEFTGLLNDFSQFMLKSQNEVRELRAYVHHLQRKEK